MIQKDIDQLVYLVKHNGSCLSINCLDCCLAEIHLPNAVYTYPCGIRELFNRDTLAEAVKDKAISILEKEGLIELVIGELL